MVRMLARVAQKGALKMPQNARNISKYLDKDISAKVIREKFIDFFVNRHNHTFVRSSPVVPFCDPTVAFVNAGMNQFKGVFLETEQPQFKKVTNSQKCIRVGGKHNDLNIVGTDGFHHTFFEMLGNWSFGDYFKKEACLMAWELLTKVYKIHPSRLYVTYFGGDKKMKLDSDLECREIWKSIGIPENRILPFGVKDNFWEMGPTGPCGPCTEIHIDHLGAAIRPEFVNKGLYDLTELWNIVFIQFNREPDGRISPLPKKHIDTGMGFERLVAVLQSKISNYDTDIFENIFSGIQKICKNMPPYQGKFGENDWNDLDTSYRVLADHARMITACLADGMIPEQNQKLRRVIRKFFTTAENKFNKPQGLLKETSNYVIESLGPFFPEMEKHSKQIHAIIEYEETVFNEVRKTAIANLEKLTKTNESLANLPAIDSPGLVPALKEILGNKTKKIDAEIAFRLYDTYGLDSDTISDISHCLQLDFDDKGLEEALEHAKNKSKRLISHKNAINFQKTVKTNDQFKYAYKKQNGAYKFDSFDAKLVSVVKQGQLVNKLDRNEPCSVVLDKTNFYSEAGGQVYDTGEIKLQNGVFVVSNVVNIGGCVFHEGLYKSATPKEVFLGVKCQPKLDENKRIENMRNHTSVHVLNAIVKKFKGVTCQKGSRVTPEGLLLELGIFGNKLDAKDVENIENDFKKIIESNAKVQIDVLDSQQLLNIDNLTLIPGETYPASGIRLVTIQNKDFQSREPCCGTHVLNTKDIEKFSIINCKSLGRSTVSLYAVTGDRAMLAQNNGKQLIEDVENLKKNIDKNIDSPEVLELAVQTIKKRLKFDLDSDNIIPFVIKNNCSSVLTDIEKTIKDSAKHQLKEFIDLEMQNVLETKTETSNNKKKYVVHYLRTSMILESVSLQKATKICPDLPILIIAFSDNAVKARCCVPKNDLSSKFNAQQWLESVSKVFSSTANAPKGQDAKLVCNMKAKKVNLQDFDALLSESLEAAKKYAQSHL